MGAEAGVGSGAKTRIEKRWRPSRRRIVKMGRVNRKPFRCGICQVAGASLSGFFLLLLAACLVAMNTSILSIHSCRIYVPNKISFVSAVWASLSAYAQRRGMGAVIEELASLVRSHVLGMAPFPQLKPHMQGKHLLMIGGAKTPIAYKRAKQLGLRMTLVDDESIDRKSVV